VDRNVTFFDDLLHLNSLPSPDPTSTSPRFTHASSHRLPVNIAANPNSSPNPFFLDDRASAPFSASQANLAGSHTLTHLSTQYLYAVPKPLPPLGSTVSANESRIRGKVRTSVSAFLPPRTPPVSPDGAPAGYNAPSCSGECVCATIRIALPSSPRPVARPRPIRVPPSHRQYRVYVAPAAAAHRLYGGGTRSAPGLPCPLPHLLHPRPRLSLHPHARGRWSIVHARGHVTLLSLVTAQRPRPPHPPHLSPPSPYISVRARGLCATSHVPLRRRASPRRCTTTPPSSSPPLFQSRSHPPLRSAGATTVRTWRSPHPPLSLHLSLILIPASLLSLCAHAVAPSHGRGAGAAPRRPSRPSRRPPSTSQARGKCTCACAHVACPSPRRIAIPLPSSLSSCPPHTVPPTIPRRSDSCVCVRARGESRAQCTAGAIPLGGCIYPPIRMPCAFSHRRGNRGSRPALLSSHPTSSLFPPHSPHCILPYLRPVRMQCRCAHVRHSAPSAARLQPRLAASSAALAQVVLNAALAGVAYA
ncbi:hypothetical protein B0H16DRAFT_125214, partial [Mycena metata]